MIGPLFARWAETDRAGAFAAAATLPAGVERESAVGETLVKWARGEPINALEKAIAIGVENPAVIAVMIKEGAARNPGKLAAWLEKQDSPLFQNARELFVRSWAEKDPVAALTWAHERGVSLLRADWQLQKELPKAMVRHHRYSLDGNSFTAALNAQPDATLSWVQSLPDPDERARFLELAIRNSGDASKLGRCSTNCRLTRRSGARGRSRGD